MRTHTHTHTHDVFTHAKKPEWARCVKEEPERWWDKREEKQESQRRIQAGEP